MAQVNRVTREITIPALEKEVANLRALRASPPTRQIGDLWEELDHETDPATGKAPLARVTSPKDDRDMTIVTTWLRWRILSENADSRYSYAHAANLHRTKEPSGMIQKEAVIYFFQARLALRIDGARCVDQSSPKSIGLKHETHEYIRPLYAHMAALPRIDRAIAMFTAAAIEEIRDARPLNSDLCLHGMRTVLRALQSSAQFESISPTDPRAPDSPGKHFQINVSEFKPEVISDDKWQTASKPLIIPALNPTAPPLANFVIHNSSPPNGRCLTFAK